MAEMKRLLAEIDERLAAEAIQRDRARAAANLKAPLVLRAASLDYLSREREEAEAAIRLVELHAAAVVDLDHEPALRMLVQRELERAGLFA